MMFRSLKKRQKGAISVEFALVAIPFFTLFFAVFEVAFVLLLSTQLENGVATAARQIRTGNIQQSASPLSAFRLLLCNKVKEVMNCNDLIIDVFNYTSFSAITPLNDPDSTRTAFAPGGPGDIVVVRVSYDWDYMTPLVAPLMEANNLFITAATAFRNEPFEEAP